MVFGSVSTADGFRGWWCKQITGSDAKGGKLVLKFPSGHVATLSLTKSAKPSVVEWTVQDHNAMKEWIGTKLLFEIQPAGSNRSDITFLHTLAVECDCFDASVNAWNYLMKSLKVFLESGTGTPV
jgi:hypothetical protein